MLTNDEFKILSETVNLLRELNTSKTINLSNELAKIYNKFVDNRNRQIEHSKKYNNKNIKYHNLQNALYYNKKKGNWSRVREIQEELKNLKNFSQK